MTKRPWRVKGDPGTNLRTSTEPGKIVSVDQLESLTPGFIAHLKGFLMTDQYQYATVLVDRFSGFTYVHLQHCITSDKTISAKKAFKQYATQVGVKITHYHADNG